MTVNLSVTKTLADMAIRNTKLSAKPTKLTDGGGLYLLLNPNGSRWWRLDYRFMGKRKTLAIGIHPDVGSKDARTRRDDARKLLAEDAHPGENRKAVKASKIAESANSLEIEVASSNEGHRTSRASSRSLYSCRSISTLTMD